MEQKKLALWLKLVIGGCAFCGILLFVYVLPVWLLALADDYPGCSGWAWTGLMWALAVPCFAVLWLGGRMAGDIEADRSFSRANALRLKRVAQLALADAALLLAGSVVITLVNGPAATPAILPLASGLVCFAGLAIAVAAACLSHLVLKAAKIQEENELTI